MRPHVLSFARRASPKHQRAAWRAVPGGRPIPLWQKFISSFCSGAIASSIGNPFDVALVRMQADSTKPVAERMNYTGVSNAVTRIVKEEGFIINSTGHNREAAQAVRIKPTLA